MHEHMKKYFSLIAILWLLSINSLMAFEGYTNVGARSASMGRTSVAMTDFWAIHNNPAGISLQQNVAVGMAYENRFLMKELSLKSGGFIMPVNFGVLGVSFNQFGYSAFNENKIGLAYARAFSPKLRLGVQLDYLATRFGEGYEGNNLFTFEIGAQSDLTEKLTVAAVVFNPVGVKQSTLTNEKIPVVMRLGLGFRFTESLFATAEFEKRSGSGADGRIGFEYNIIKHFYARAGVAVNPGLFSFGAGWQTNMLQIDLAASVHQILGTIAQASLVFHFGSRNKP